MGWREKVDPTLRKYLETIISEVSKQRDVYRLAPRPDSAQLWIAIADLSKQIVNLNSKLNYLEGALAEFVKTRSKVVRKARVTKRKTTKRKNRKLEKSLRKY